jgi:hypothetical protein
MLFMIAPFLELFVRKNPPFSFFLLPNNVI